MGVNYTADDYKPTLRSLLPRGKAWNFDLESNFLKLVFSFAVEMARVSNRALELITQVDPRTTTELLSDWERVLGLPDTCQGVLPASIEERRQDVISRLTMVGGQSRYPRLKFDFQSPQSSQYTPRVLFQVTQNSRW